MGCRTNVGGITRPAGSEVDVTATRPVDISELRKKTRLLGRKSGGCKVADRMASRVKAGGAPKESGVVGVTQKRN